MLAKQSFVTTVGFATVLFAWPKIALGYTGGGVEVCSEEMLEELTEADPDALDLPTLLEGDPAVPDLIGGMLPPELATLRDILLDAGASLDLHAKFSIDGAKNGFGYHPYPYQSELACLSLNHFLVEQAVIVDFSQPLITYLVEPFDGHPPMATAVWFEEIEPPSTDFVCPSDIDRNGVVGVLDLLIVLAEWGQCADVCPPCRADLNGDGMVDLKDVLIMLEEWGECVVPSGPEPELFGIITMHSWVVTNCAGMDCEVTHVEIPNLIEEAAFVDGDMCLIFSEDGGLTLNEFGLKCCACDALVNFIAKPPLLWGTARACAKLCSRLIALGPKAPPICCGLTGLVEWAIRYWGAPWVCRKIGACNDGCRLSLP